MFIVKLFYIIAMIQSYILEYNKIQVVCKNSFSGYINKLQFKIIKNVKGKYMVIEKKNYFYNVIIIIMK
ncbi:hypothetical protein PFMC_05893 [Plasmodium falciparum CAMP/Malaysia]|uniref:Uncharacterized protein n=1 Tax=Plasmodium falciparum (isolate Camp / Malaysia) TaxID=5835 RepID=A0A024X153_PLAFC|nr:hypothetical protein PFMC_05893 [Plasmodium falciparum CAMP/Malaysia]